MNPCLLYGSFLQLEHRAARISEKKIKAAAHGAKPKSQKIPIIVAGKKIIPIFALPDFGTKQLTIA